MHESIMEDNFLTKSELETTLEYLSSYLPNKIKPEEISKMSTVTAYEIGWDLGKKKALEFAISKNFDADSIRNQWFIVSNKIENDFD